MAVMPDAASPTIQPPEPRGLSNSLRRNIEVLAERRRQEAAAATPQQRLAGAITAFTGSMLFVYIHLLIYGTWIVWNSGLIPALPKFDPSFVILATEASVEAIFLSTFVLISQNGTAAAADKRADLDLHINLLAEHELTKLTELVAAIATHLELPIPDSEDIEENERDVAPEAVLDALDAEKAAER